MRVLHAHLRKISGANPSLGSLTRDLSTAGIMQNLQTFQSLLKEGEVTRYTAEELSTVCWSVYHMFLQLSDQTSCQAILLFEETVRPKLDLQLEYDGPELSF